MVPRLLISLWLLATLAGCGSSAKLGQVSGVVRASGKPLAGVVVTFVPDGNETTPALRSLAQTDAEGRYRLRTEDGRDGAIVGKHSVTVEDLAIQSAPRSEDGTVLKRPPVRFSPSYADPIRTPLKFEVKPDSQTIDLDLSQSP